MHFHRELHRRSNSKRQDSIRQAAGSNSRGSAVAVCNRVTLNVTCKYGFYSSES